MQAIFYLIKTGMKNRVKKALTKPITYVFIIGIVLYAAMIFYGFGVILEQGSLGNITGFVAIMTVGIFVLKPSNIIAYTKRKGLLYRPSDVHFVFTAPIGCKKVLLYPQLKAILISMLIGLGFSIAGILWFQIPIWKMVIYFLIAVIVDNVLEAAMVILLYGNERLSDKQIKIFPWLSYLCIGSFFLMGLFLVYQQGISIESVIQYLNSPFIQCVPIVGWNIAVIRLIFLGPDTINIICSTLYFLSTGVLLYMAYKMKCTGEYYENAMKFADDYEEVMRKKKGGEVVMGIGKKTKYKKANISYKGSGAKAIFYRQLLEYKKSRFFLFDMTTLFCAAAGVGIAALGYFSEITSNQEFIIPGVMAYIIFIFSNLKTKWSKELENPYTYLIPDSTFRKLWYSTLPEHLKALIDGTIMTVPAAIGLGISPVQAILSIVLYVCLQACKLYLTIMAEGLLGNLLGTVAKQILRAAIFGAIFGIGILGAVIGTMIFSIDVGFIVMIGIVAFQTLGCMFVAAGVFERLELV